MNYNKVQHKITCGKEEKVVDEKMYFHYSADETEAIRLWLADSSFFHIIKCLIKSKLNRAKLRELAIDNIDTKNQLKEMKRERFMAVINKKRQQEGQACTTNPSLS